MSGALVLDTSAIMAICLDEPETEQFLQLLMASEELFLAAPTRLELGMVGHHRGIPLRISQLLETHEVQVMAFDAAMADIAIGAFERYGKGRHKAALNFGDCCTYALAKTLSLPLLYKGEDFAQTDIPSALA
jgi:ribonuclease VapC